eukprot:339300-Rhodomonas_salina.2
MCRGPLAAHRVRDARRMRCRESAEGDAAAPGTSLGQGNGEWGAWLIPLRATHGLDSVGDQRWRRPCAVAQPTTSGGS